MEKKNKLKKTKKYDDMSFIPIKLQTVLILSVKSVHKLVGKLFTSP
jgi:hypothetical protein